ncbi:LysR family transcriptional regulator [Lysinibacillus sp. OL1_EC]|uniref:LysR family transcriptional regulator n=1 Tax=unclassified Lysinibacillus TaxID=2636778 RepID=UPI00103F672A|nr:MULTISPECIES: LysR family transcriptional regulator [unclassified Lysinibacillus]MCM0627467.1 LysR family transcriptional regulator [Lysinibacillus sp. OL1_EC]TBV86668.1 LysR family transcriptional regulator [Lysinibacillus sp. OL1]UKJ43663.1 LysR family transcriptional regulator [Lysinibacillus sp. ACHW1.5]
MELRHLEYFLMVSKELHFTKAAEKLGISQPTLSHQIKILEKEIGYSLFNRIGKKIELTQVGEIVQKEALNIQGSLQSLFSQITEFTEVEIGELRIAVLPGEITDLVSTLCILFNQLYPNIKVFIQTTDQVEKAVLENRADFGIDFQINTNDLLQVTKLYDEEFYLIGNQSNDEQKVSFSSVLDSPLILFPSMHQCRKIIDKTSYELGKQIEPIVETSSIKSILSLVRSGVGCSIVSRTLYEFYDTEDLFFQKIENPTLTSTVYLVMKKNCFINYAAREYIKLLVREIEKLYFHTNKDDINSLRSFIL